MLAPKGPPIRSNLRSSGPRPSIHRSACPCGNNIWVNPGALGQGWCRMCPALAERSSITVACLFFPHGPFRQVACWPCKPGRRANCRRLPAGRLGHYQGIMPGLRIRAKCRCPRAKTAAGVPQVGRAQLAATWRRTTFSPSWAINSARRKPKPGRAPGLRGPCLRCPDAESFAAVGHLS